MKKIAIVFGLIAGLIVSAWMVASIAYCYGTGKFEGNMLLGFASMIIAFAVMYPAVKKYRDTQNNGIISFANAFKMSISIALIGSTLYVAIWMIDYYFFIPDFMERFTSHLIEKNKSNMNVSQEEVKANLENVVWMKKMYTTPFGVALLTYMEILPIGIIVSLITSLILKRKTNSGNVAVAA